MDTSYFPNCETSDDIPQHLSNADMESLLLSPQLELLESELLALVELPIPTSNDVCVEPPLELGGQPFSSEVHPHDHLFPPTQNLPPLEQFDSCHCRKRCKSCQNDNQANYNQLEIAIPDFPGLDKYDCNRQMLTFDPYTGVSLPVYGNGNFNTTAAVDGSDWRKQESNSRNGGEGERTLSTQSLAARLRRRKITEKTQQLAKLIPGAHKFNTAEMFEASFKYVKFLQAQLTVLQFMNSTEKHAEEEDGFGRQELQLLLASPSVQEKLYSEEKCLVSMEIAKKLPSTL
ncbi:hypothetical protein Nepgr_032880 [Nepenthes gracilis]|uniref:BHLH domain-containing protein n=1 Tax=Nepenthes gracilis TaxID=150966 RepID=A0AAD3TLN7_NEPGR|nr:hypothetical protein Nepgr_032880 [Nepenthes gracilis]